MLTTANGHCREPMPCPTLAELPPPPPTRTDWPWTAESPQLPETMPTGQPWPRVSIVTPSYNQAQFIEETLLSVKRQDYAYLEHIVIDGASTDDTVDTLQRYFALYNHERSHQSLHYVVPGKVHQGMLALVCQDETLTHFAPFVVQHMGVT